MGRCGCSTPEDCGCVFSSSEGITASGTGSPENPILLEPAPDYSLVFTCTSGSRPVDPNSGQVIYETDTGFVWFWTGGSWRLLKPITTDGDAVQAMTSATYTGAGPHTIGTLTLPTPFAAGQPFTALVSATVTLVSTGDGDSWDTYLDRSGTILDAQRKVVASNLISTKLGPVDLYSPSGADIVVTVKVLAVSASVLQFLTFNHPAYNQIRAKRFLAT